MERAFFDFEISSSIIFPCPCVYIKVKKVDLLDAMVEWIQSLLIHKIEFIPSNPHPTKPSPKAANIHAN